jgi:hypothetical protein
MAIGQTPTNWWQIGLDILRIIARLPLAIVVIFGAGCLGWLTFWMIWRITEYLYCNFLNHTWNIPWLR